jgi:hypothetical protein
VVAPAERGRRVLLDSVHCLRSDGALSMRPASATGGRPGFRLAMIDGEHPAGVGPLVTFTHSSGGWRRSLGEMTKDPALMHDRDAMKSFEQACRNFEQMTTAFESMATNMTQAMKGMHGDHQ